ncbi:MAG: DUF896 domain-containing protein [Turicibacter sp.]|nr:DUF896 domain-containing protein [Turicibacter sp.]
MLTEEKLKRLNALALKKKQGQLTPEETKEQQHLREEYLANFRAGMIDTIENVKVIDPEGNDVTPEKLKRIQAEKNNRPDIH